MGQTSSLNIENFVDFTKNIELTINNVKYKVPKNIRPETTLNYFIRNVANLKGTKFMCLEGGCGVCIVAVNAKNHAFSVNSCLVPIFLCNGWHITTIEGIGGKKDGYNTLQITLAEMNGSQCGYCSPAMVMNMYSLIERGKTTTEEIEDSFGSNICRCTGYRHILNAFQLFANNSKSLTSFYDIEDTYKSVLCKKDCDTCSDICKDFVTINNDASKVLYLQLKGAKFLKVFNIKQIFTIFKTYPELSYILNGGNTGNGVYRMNKKDLYIDINDVNELTRIEKNDTTLTLGGGVTLEMAKESMYKFATHPGFEYLRHLGDHINRIGHVSLRNIGTIAGNLMLKHDHHEFPSDLFLILETTGSQIHLLQSESSKIILSMINFLKTDMKHKLIYSVVLPKLNPQHVYKSFKIMPRAQNAHAYVNAGFCFKLDEKTRVLQRPNIIFGGINPDFFHAEKTEKFLTGKIILNREVLKTALNILDSELNPDYILPDAKPEYRKRLAQSLFYKFILNLKPTQINIKLRSGGVDLQRGISSGKDDYDVDKSLWPINQPVQKLEALYQTAGEAEYVNDIPERENELHGVLALANAIGKIKQIDASEAMKMDGVVAFYSAKDIPGKNTFINASQQYPFISADEPLFAETEIMYVGQPYGIIVAKSQYEALDAIKKVKLIYSNGPQKRPLITVQDVLGSHDTTRLFEIIKVPATSPPGQNIKHVIKGSFETNSQYHFTMEPQCCVVIPTEDGLNVFVSTQFMDCVQTHIGICLGIPFHKINIQVRRVGGSYGSKLTRATLIACATALAALKLQQPVRFNMTMEDMMNAIGKRAMAYQEYEVGVSESGKIQYLNSNHWTNEGYVFNDTVNSFLMALLKNCYDSSTWNLVATDAKTDLACSTWIRAPGSAEGLAMIENIMEHIAKVTKKDPIEVRLENLNPEDQSLVKSMVDEIIKTSDYRNRNATIKSFNEENRWKKRGISLVLMRFELILLAPYHSLVSVYARDGTVAISHGGIEMGQGINTKVAQVAANVLGIDITKISIKPANTLTAPNTIASAASIASDCCASATKIACEELVKRLKPIKDKLQNPSWEELVIKAHSAGIDLCSIHAYNATNDLPQIYSVYGATVAEVEVDVLTGEHITKRVDLLEDTGISLNPDIDMGQIQGAFIMGLGLWTSEELHYDKRTGELTNYRTWNYKPPGAKDIPVDFRVSFLRNSSNPQGVYRSKATGEPALCMSFAIPIAIRNALYSARADAGNFDVWYEMNGAMTAEKILLTSLTKKEDMIM